MISDLTRLEPAAPITNRGHQALAAGRAGPTPSVARSRSVRTSAGEALERIVMALAEGPDGRPGGAADVVVREVVRVLGAEGAGLWTADRAEGGFRLLAQHGAPAPGVARLGLVPFAPGGPAAAAAETSGASWMARLPHLKLEPSDGPTLSLVMSARRGRRHGARLLFAGEQLSGVLLYTFAPQPRHALSRQRRAFLAAVAGLCALLLERDALRREVVLRRREAEAAAAGRREAIEARDLALTTAAHELRSPLTAVSGYAQLLLRACQEPRVTGQAMPGTHGEDSSWAEGVLRQIVDRTRVMNRLVLELLDTARRAWGTMELHKEPTDVAQLVRCVAGAPREGVPAGRVVVRTPAGAVRAVVDPVRLEQVLNNLVDNALKYSPAGTPVEVRLATPRRQTLRLTVRDYGPGVPPAQRERIFEPFYRVEGTSRAGGLGLGLAVCRDIVAAHQGAIAVQNPTGGGARFCVTLPRGLGPAGERPARATGRG